MHQTVLRVPGQFWQWGRSMTGGSKDGSDSRRLGLRQNTHTILKLEILAALKHNLVVTVKRNGVVATKREIEF